MKTLKLITALIAIVFSSNLLFASNLPNLSNDTIPAVLSNDSTNKTIVENVIKLNIKDIETISIPMVDNFHNDLILTDEQKVKLKKEADTYAACLLQARAMNSKEESYAFMRKATTTYEVALDGILSSEQKTKKEMKSKERVEELVKNLKKIK